MGESVARLCEESVELMATDALKLAAWRFLAAHRVGSLAVSHAQFIDGSDGPHINAPSRDQYYESASAPTWGEAAIKLARSLGMPDGA